MAHSMGLAVLNLENKNIPKTRRFVNNNYTYYYPSYEHRVTTEPAKGKDYTDDNTKQTVRASAAFSGNIPCSSKNTTAVRYLQIVKPSTNVSFKASDESGKPRSAWGTHTSYTFNVAQNAAMTKSITTDADFYYLARKYDCTQRQRHLLHQKVEHISLNVGGHKVQTLLIIKQGYTSKEERGDMSQVIIR